MYAEMAEREGQFCTRTDPYIQNKRKRNGRKHDGYDTIDWLGKNLATNNR
jgi:hypothetical protein